MRNFLLFILLYSLNNNHTAAQSNTTQQLIYLNDEFYVCAKEDAYYVGITIDKEDETDVIAYHLNGKQALTGTYSDKNLQKRNGTFTWFDTNGIRIAVVEYKNNIQDGLYLFWYDNKILRDSGSFRKGTPDGIWKSWFANGQLRMICNYNAKALADFRKTYSGGNAAVELVQLAKPQKIVNLARQEPVQDIAPRLRRSYYGNLQEKDRIFNTVINGENNESEIQGTKSAEDDQHIIFSHITIRYDLVTPSPVIIDGNYYTFYSNGQPRESGTYTEGHKKGFWETWYENGKRQSVGRYDKNHEVQEWKYYDDKGELILVRQFKKDGRLANEIKMK